MDVSDSPAARAFLEESARSIDAVLDELLPPVHESPSKLHEAMRYSALAPGKRLRPALALATCRALGGDAERCLRPAAALEMIHAYSLIHDDLPAMDDDEMRRGQPTCHVAHGEAMAILAGDALHTLACEVLATHPEGDEHAVLRSRVQDAVLPAVGWRGMVGGQVLDMELTGRAGSVSEEEVREIHARKTGALLRASVALGAVLGGARPEVVGQLDRFAEAAGLAFQVVDDVLDVTAGSDALGKTGGKDEAAGKVTYPAVLGLDAARRRAAELTASALSDLEAVPIPEHGDAAPLRNLVAYILERTS